MCRLTVACGIIVDRAVIGILPVNQNMREDSISMPYVATVEIWSRHCVIVNELLRDVLFSNDKYEREQLRSQAE